MTKQGNKTAVVINLDDFVIKPVVFKIGETEYQVKRLTFADYKQASEMFKNLGENPSFEDIEKLILFMVPTLTTEVINDLDMNQLNQLMEIVGSQLTK